MSNDLIMYGEKTQTYEPGVCTSKILHKSGVPVPKQTYSKNLERWAFLFLKVLDYLQIQNFQWATEFSMCFIYFIIMTIKRVLDKQTSLQDTKKLDYAIISDAKLIFSFNFPTLFFLASLSWLFLCSQSAVIPFWKLPCFRMFNVI